MRVSTEVVHPINVELGRDDLSVKAWNGTILSRRSYERTDALRVDPMVAEDAREALKYDLPRPVFVSWTCRKDALQGSFKGMGEWPVADIVKKRRANNRASIEWAKLQLCSKSRGEMSGSERVRES